MPAENCNVITFAAQVRSAWLALASAGIATFPASPDKRPLIKGWQTRATTNPDKIAAWLDQWPDAVPALPTGERNGISVLDLDVKDGRDGIAAIEDQGLNLTRPFRVRTPSGGLHVYFGHRDGLTNADKHLPHGVDVRGEGGYVLAPGAVLPDGRSYTIEDGCSLDDLEMLWPFPSRLMPPPREEAPKTPQAHDDLTAEDLKEILAELAQAPPLANGDRPWIEARDGNVKVGMALHDWSGGSREGFALWRAHAEQSTRYKGLRNLRQQWESFSTDKGEAVTVGSLIFAAPEWCDRRHTVGPEDFEDDEGEDLIEAAKAALLTFTAPADLSLTTARRPIVKGLIAESDVGCVVGAPGVGKSLLAPRLAWAVAQGRDIFGCRVKAGRVFYVAAEDEIGMRARLMALHRLHGDAPALRLVGGVSDLLTRKAPQLKALSAAVEADRPALVIVDTLAMAFPGLEENSAEGMGRVVAVARSLARWGAAVLLVHHDTKDGQQGLPRGHSLLNGALDVSLHLKRGDNGIVRGTLTKNRNGSCDLDLAFRIGVETLGEDGDGDPITAGVCEPLGISEEFSKPRLTRNERAAFGALRDIVDAAGIANVDAWRTACVSGTEVFSGDTVKARGVRFLECRKGLVAKDRITISDDVVQVIGFSGVTAADFEDETDE